MRELSAAERIIAGSAIALFVASLLPWFTIDTDVYDGNRNGWDVDFPFGPLPVLLGLVMLAHLAFARFAPDIQLPDLPWPRIHFVAGPVAAILVVTKLVSGETVSVYDFDRAAGIVIAAVASIGLAAGGVLYHHEQP